ncbi:MAG: MFS transporter [Bdellovibrionaceae bacterium]|nr:MFS transporter [Pseudobdellovibrionaceae bacterium]
MIEVQNLTKMYGPHTAIQNLNFNVEAGEVVGFLGPNGAGKSTTMKIITGFIPSSSGTVRVAGHDIFKNPIEVKRNLGYLPETPPVYMEMKVQDYIKFSAQIHELPHSKIKNSVDLALEKTGLTHVKNRVCGNLSKGYRQRVGLAAALVHDPKVLILDEPTVGLDPKQIIDIRSLIKGLAGEHTVILSSHILPEITATCQRVIIINQGQIVAQDSLERLDTRLKQGTTYLLTVRNLSGYESLSSIPGVSSVQVEGETIQIHTEPKAGDIRDQIAEHAVKAGLGLLEFSSEKLSLEDIFLQLTTKEPTGDAS